MLHYVQHDVLYFPHALSGLLITLPFYLYFGRL